MSKAKSFILGVFDDEQVLLSAVKKVREGGVSIDEVYSPYPIHGIDPLLGYKMSKLPIAAFLFGLCGLSFAVWMQTYMLGFDWPMIIGGKPHLAFPSFVPVSFELTVLIASLGMVATFLIISGLKPDPNVSVLDVRITDDKFVMAIDADKVNGDEATALLKDSGAIEVNRKEVE